MSKQQSLPFITGCLFQKMDTNILKKLKAGDTPIRDCEFIPKVMFGLTCSHSAVNDILGDQKMFIKNTLEDALCDMYPQFEITVVKIVPDKQYIRFDYTVVKKVPVKKMTVEQIEKELGYKVEIVSEV